MLFKDSQWFSELQQQLMSNAALEGHFIIFILGLPFETWLWQMLSHSCIRMNVRKMHTTKTDCGTICFGAQCALHRMNMGDNMNIIDDVETFLSTIWFNKLRGIHEKDHWAYNDESFTASYEMYVWTTGWFPWRLMITYTWKVLFQLEASSWLINNLDGCWHDAHNQSKDNFQKNPGEKILHDESSNTALGGQSQAW
jgi:hypothetical protein